MFQIYFSNRAWLLYEHNTIQTIIVVPNYVYAQCPLLSLLFTLNNDGGLVIFM